MSALSSSSALKPYSVVMHSVSTPPTTAASITPERDQARRAGVGLGAGGARGGDHERRAAQAQRGLHVARQRGVVVRLAVVQPRTAARRWPGRAAGRRPRCAGCPRCWCRGTRRRGRRRVAPPRGAPGRRSRRSSAPARPGGCCGSRSAPARPAVARRRSPRPRRARCRAWRSRTRGGPGRCGPRAARSRVAATPTPSALTTVWALMASGFMPG